MDAKMWDIPDDSQAVELNLQFGLNEVTRTLKLGSDTIGLVSEISLAVTL